MADKIQGIFSVEKTAKIGTGSTEKKVKQQMYCQAIEKEDGQIEVRYLGKNDEPIYISERIPKDVFIRDSVFQPYFLEERKAEKEKKANEKILTAEQHFSNSAL